MSDYNLAHRTPHFSKYLQSPSMYSDMLHSKLHRLCNTVSPPASTPCTCHLLFVCLFPLLVVSIIDRQWADANSDCTHCIRRGLCRRLRSSLLLNPSPRCGPPCRIVYLTF